jgi:hypothetical protein
VIRQRGRLDGERGALVESVARHHREAWSAGRRIEHNADHVVRDRRELRDAVAAPHHDGRDRIAGLARRRRRDDRDRVDAAPLESRGQSDARRACDRGELTGRLLPDPAQDHVRLAVRDPARERQRVGQDLLEERAVRELLRVSARHLPPCTSEPTPEIPTNVPRNTRAVTGAWGSCVTGMRRTRTGS